MFSLRIFDEPQTRGSQAKAPANHAARSSNNQRNQTQDGNGEKDGDGITDAQKRYLFRILADQGLEGDAALAHLTQRLGVEVLNNATKREASALIEELLGSAATT